MKWHKFLIAALLISLSAVFFSCDQKTASHDKEEDIQTALNWGGLYKLPENASSIDIQTNGSILTRQFIIKFKCNKEGIENWIQQSKRLKNNHPLLIKENISRYEIYPGENNAEGGYVEINAAEGAVTINISWS